MSRLRNPVVLRVVLVVLLLGGAYLAWRPWLSCAYSLPGWNVDLMRICTFGTGNPAFDAHGPGRLWPYLVAAAVYLLAAVAVAFTRGIRFDPANQEGTADRAREA